MASVTRQHEHTHGSSIMDLAGAVCDGDAFPFVSPPYKSRRWSFTGASGLCACGVSFDEFEQRYAKHPELMRFGGPGCTRLHAAWSGRPMRCRGIWREGPLRLFCCVPGSAQRPQAVRRQLGLYKHSAGEPSRGRWAVLVAEMFLQFCGGRSYIVADRYTDIWTGSLPSWMACDFGFR